MLTLSQRIAAFDELSVWLYQALLEDSETHAILEDLTQQAFIKNGWFTPKESTHALTYWADALSKSSLNNWLEPYPINDGKPQRILLVLAGNIPMVGFHDILSVMLSGHKAIIKCSSNDDVLIPFLMTKLHEIEPEMDSHFEIVKGLTKSFDAVIATGSNNSARHFTSYFEHVPHIIRTNRTGVAVLSGQETKNELHGLMIDAFRYFGLGCRNVTKMYLPQGYDLNEIFGASTSFAYLMDNKKYVNNYIYHKAIMMMERQNVLENELILMLENTSNYSPVSVLHYEYYSDETALSQRINADKDEIQCVIGKHSLPFGHAQKPKLNDYADSVDTLEFLVNL